MTSQYLTSEAFAAKLGISLRTFQRQAKQPGFPAPLRVGRCLRWPQGAVLEFFEQDQRAQQGDTDDRTTS